MSEPLFFRDLAGPNRIPTRDEERWLTAIAAETNTESLVVRLATSNAATDVEPVVYRELNGKWRAGRYIGEIRRDGRMLEIRPRLAPEILGGWASAALNVRMLPNAADLQRASHLIAEFVAAAWRAALTDAARHSLPTLREDKRAIGPYVRGRLDPRETIRLRARGSPFVASRPWPKLLDNPATQSIARADQVLNTRINRTGWRGSRLEELLPHFHAAVGPRPQLPTHRQLAKVRYTPITLPYKRAAELSWQIAKRRGLRGAATSETSDGILIDVAELWELFLVHCCKRAYGTADVTHTARAKEGPSLLRSRVDENRRLGRLYPDILVGDTGNPKLILDAKYKSLNDVRRVDRDDLYQLGAYLSIYRNAPLPSGMLGYPAFSDSTPEVEQLSPWESPFGHPVIFRRLPLDEANCVAALTARG